MKMQNKTMMLAAVICLLCGTLLGGESTDAAGRKAEILPVPWDKIVKAMLMPSDNAFRRSSFIIEDLVFEPLPDGFTGGKIPLQYQVLASLMGFQSARHLRGGIFNFFDAPEELLRDYRGTEADQVKARFESFRKEAAETFARVYPDQATAPTARQLTACWLHSLDSASPANAMNQCQEKLFLEKRRCIPMKSRAAEAKVILMQGLPLLALDANGNGHFCLGFYETKEMTCFVVLECADIKSPSLFSFVKKDADARRLAKVMEWQDGWSILYVPWMTIGYYKEERMQGIVPFDE